jgi:hypothetical protein
MAGAKTDQPYAYLVASELDRADERLELALATSGGKALHPHFFSGFVGRPRQSAQAMLAVAEVARTRYFEPPAMVRARILAADPIVTSGGERLRFEAFSLCCGVHARLDFEPAALDGSFAQWGTTNVDFNPHMRAALAAVSDADAMLMQVGHDELSLTTLQGHAVERRVPLPERWLKGLAEVQVACSTMTLRHELPPVEARRFLQGLPRSRAGLAWATPAGRGLRLSSRSAPAAVCLAGGERLRLLEKLLGFARGLRVYGPEPGAGGTRAPEASAWELVLEDARMTFTLSPEVYRGFSGEGGILLDLASAPAGLIDEIASILCGDPVIDPIVLSRTVGASVDDVCAALRALGAAGRVGYDLAQRAFFHRELPFERSVLERMHPRIAGARQLLADGHVRLEPDARSAGVMSGEVEYRVRFEATGPRCTCPWFVKHAGARGPCKHVLAAELARAEAPVG